MKKIVFLLIFVIVFTMISGMISVKASGFTPRTTAPNKNEQYYYNDLYNPFPAKGQNCTWYAFGRAYELLGKRPNVNLTGNACDWWEYNKNNNIYPYGQTPKLGAIACYAGQGAYWGGHVGIVEKIENGVVITSNSEYGGESFVMRNVGYYTTVQPFQGYIYILDDVSNEPPKTSKLTINKTVAKVGEEITFTSSGNGATGYTIGINKDGKRIYTADIPSTFSKSFSEAGEYSAYVTAWNSTGLVDSERVYFTIYDKSPSSSVLMIDKEIINKGENITFNCISKEATGFTIGINKDGKRIFTQDISQVFTKKFNEPGVYSAYVTSWNDIGICDSKRVVFVVREQGETVVLRDYVSIRIIKEFAGEGLYIVTLYNNLKLVDIIIFDKAFIDETISCSENFNKVKFMVWESYESLKPMCEAEEITEGDFVIKS